MLKRHNIIHHPNGAVPRAFRTFGHQVLPRGFRGSKTPRRRTIIYVSASDKLSTYCFPIFLL